MYLLAIDGLLIGSSTCKSKSKIFLLIWIFFIRKIDLSQADNASGLTMGDNRAHLCTHYRGRVKAASSSINQQETKSGASDTCKEQGYKPKLTSSELT